MDLPNYDELLENIFKEKISPFFDKNRANGYGGLNVVWKGIANNYEKNIRGLFFALKEIAGSKKPYEEKFSEINTRCVSNLRSIQSEIKNRSPTENLNLQYVMAVKIIIAEFQRIFTEAVTAEARKKVFGK